jgi:hypothetical protein
MVCKCFLICFGHVSGAQVDKTGMHVFKFEAPDLYNIYFHHGSK